MPIQPQSPLMDRADARPVRILVVDDSIAARRMVALALSHEPGLEVVGYASNGALALEQTARLSPDVLTLDIEMPEMDGLETLRRLRAEFPRVRVIMLSSLTQRGARARSRRSAWERRTMSPRPPPGQLRSLVGGAARGAGAKDPAVL